MACIERTPAAERTQWDERAKSGEGRLCLPREFGWPGEERARLSPRRARNGQDASG